MIIIQLLPAVIDSEERGKPGGKHDCKHTQTSTWLTVHH